MISEEAVLVHSYSSNNHNFLKLSSSSLSYAYELLLVTKICFLTDLSMYIKTAEFWSALVKIFVVVSLLKAFIYHLFHVSYCVISTLASAIKFYCCLPQRELLPPMPLRKIPLKNNL